MTLSIKKKTLRKVVSSLTMLATVVSMSGIMALSSVNIAAAAVVDGSLIKSNATNSDGTPTVASLDVYIVKLVGTKMFKRLILNPTVFESYGHLNWGDIQTVSQAVMDEYTTSSLVRVDTDPAEKVFAMAPDGDIGSKSWVNLTATDFLSLPASENGDSIYTINAVDGGNYTAVADVTTVAELTTFYTTGVLPGVTPVPTTGALAVALSASTPASANTYEGSDGVLFSKINFTAGDAAAIVTGMTVKRTGVGSYQDFNNVWLVVDGIRRGSVKSLNSADEASLLFSAETNKVTVNAGATKTFELWASMGTTNAVAGDANALGITAVSTASTVTGLPVYGNVMNMSAVSAPAVTLDEATIGNTASVGDANVTVAKFKVHNGQTSETAVFEGITFKSVTKAAVGPTTYTRAYTTDFTNFRMYDNAGNLVAGPVEMGSDNYLRFTLSAPFAVPAGTSKLEWFTVKADVADGAGRTLNLSVEGTYDVVVRGGTNLIRSAITNNYTDANEYVTLSASDLSISADSVNNPIAADVNENSTIVLLKGNIIAGKGAVNADTLRVTLTGTDMDFNASTEFDNLRVYINNILVSETSSLLDTADDSAAAANETSVYAAFTDSFSVSGTVPVRVEIDVKDLKSGDTGTDIKATITGSTITGTTVADGTAVNGTGTATGNTQTVVIPGYKIYKSATPVTVSKVVGAQDVQFLGIDIKANNTVPVVVNKIKVELNDDAGTITAGQNDVQNIELTDVNGNVIAGPANLNASLEYEFTGLNLTVDSNGTKVIVRGDIASTLTDTSYTADGSDGLWFAIISSEGTANNNTYYGANSAGTTLADGVAEVNTATGTIININAGTITATLASDTPISAQLVATSTDNAIAKWKLVAANEDIQVKKFRVGLTTGPAGEDEISRIGLYEGTTKLAETYSFAGGYTEFDITSKNFKVLAGTGNARYLTMKVDLTSTTDTVLDSGATVAGVLIDLTTFGSTAEINPISGSTVDGFAFAAVGGVPDTATVVTTATTVTMSAANHGILNGDIIKLGSEQMYVTSGAGTTSLTVVRGFNGTIILSAGYAGGTAVTVARSLEGNNFKAYGAKVAVTEGGLSSGSLAAGTTYWTAFKFTVTPATNSVEDVVLNSVRVSLSQSSGIGAVTATDYFIGSMALYNGAGTLISELSGETIATPGTCAAGDGLCVSTDYVVFDEATKAAKNTAGGAGLGEAVASTGETYTVKVKVSNAVATNDTLQLSIADLGTISAAGHVDWDDSVSSSITWVGDGVNASVVGPQFKN
jgi:hypothetical protein